MNIVYDMNNLKLSNIFFLDSKRNIIMDGKFTKIIHSDELITINGIYLQILFSINLIDKSKLVNKNMNKYFMKFIPNDTNNNKIINELTKIEEGLIDHYKKTFSCKKTPIFLLKDQLITGNVKLYREIPHLNKKSDFILKISGIWENNENIGITYKFMEVYSL
jgi:hypothetical protein